MIGTARLQGEHRGDAAEQLGIAAHRVARPGSKGMDQQGDQQQRADHRQAVLADAEDLLHVIDAVDGVFQRVGHQLFHVRRVGAGVDRDHRDHGNGEGRVFAARNVLPGVPAERGEQRDQARRFVHDAALEADGGVAGVHAAADAVLREKAVEPGQQLRAGPIDYALHPRWVLDVGLRGRPHGLGNVAKYVPGAGSGNVANFMLWMAGQFDPSVTWKDIEWLRTVWKGNLVLKGILDVEDARQAVGIGADGMIVSNHGGRQLDGVASTAAMMPRMAKSKGLYLNYKMDLAFEQYQVELDPLLFKQLLSNLLNNAIKFTPEGGVDLSLTLLEQQGEQLLVLLKVKDTGVGLTPEQSEKVLKPFAQLASSEQISGERGTGLGLSICQTIVQLMQGRLSIDSEIGHGTEIQIKLLLPCRAAALTEPDKKLSEENADENQQHQPLKLLVVDDHQVNRMLLQRQLSYLGHQVWQAADGAEALQLLKELQLDLVLTDCTMPLMDGYQLAQAIRADEALQNLVVLGLTARAQSDEIARCIAAGMNDCLFKPISINELQQSIQKYAKGKAAFNIDALFALAGPDPAFARQMLSTLCQSNSADIEQLKLLLQQSDWNALKRLAHKIKGAAVLVQAEQLIDSCETLEKATEQQITSASLRVLAALKVFNREAQLWCDNSQKELASDEEN